MRFQVVYRNADNDLCYKIIEAPTLQNLSKKFASDAVVAVCRMDTDDSCEVFINEILISNLKKEKAKVHFIKTGNDTSK